MFGFKTAVEFPESLVQARTRYATALQVLADLQDKRRDGNLELAALNVKQDELKAKIKQRPGHGEEVDQQLLDLEAELARLLQERELVERELLVLEKRADKARAEIERTRAAMWEEVLAVLLEQAPPGLKEWLAKACTAAQLVKRCDAVGTVLDRIGWTPPLNRDRGSAEGQEFTYYAQEMQKEFSLPHE